MNAVKWSTEECADAYTEPSEASWIKSKPNQWRDNTVRVAVYDGKLTVEPVSYTHLVLQGAKLAKQV